ncbi:hypothetical protein CYY_005786 [Polysphondylium violaceum]|uniref:2Fe-2S ferredoxin-type domain-containing protein n=1 Tax=Polysphondylium violaceum TaxID=133409 RepID=A0A8J4PT92_9MYCE|nr:hypothetical protein CYY_005786 [Polysphondylium violaceum]
MNIIKLKSIFTPSSLVTSYSRCGDKSLFVRYFSSKASNTDKKDLVTFNYINKDGSKSTVSAPVGENVLEVAHDNDIDLEGACECSVACSTCHVYVEPKYYNMLPEPTDEENDMLDLAFDLKENSRLGCQIVLTKELEGMTVTLPSASRNMFVDGYKPPKH